VKTSVFQKKGGGGLQTEKAYFETNRQEAHFWVAKSGSLFLGLSKDSKNANSFSGCLKVEGQLYEDVKISNPGKGCIGYNSAANTRNHNCKSST
jgi:hypothetical protein